MDKILGNLEGLNQFHAVRNQACVRWPRRPSECWMHLSLLLQARDHFDDHQRVFRKPRPCVIFSFILASATPAPAGGPGLKIKKKKGTASAVPFTHIVGR